MNQPVHGATDPRVDQHGGPDAWGQAAHDFSTNANACGPCPAVLQALAGVDASSYPDPTGTALRHSLARWHGVAEARIVLAASASEFIQRFTAMKVREGVASVWLPAQHYLDCARAAQAWGLARAQQAADAGLLWACEPGTPLGQGDAGLPARVAALLPPQSLVLDLAYEPLRLAGASSLPAAQRDRVWQLWSPNKALGLCGLRGAYAIAPPGANVQRQWLEQLAPSWPLGAHAQAMLLAWTRPATQAWLCDSRVQLAAWKTRQIALCQSLGWTVWPSDANFFTARLPPACDPFLSWSRAHFGLKLRDAGSFGLPGCVRLGVRPPASQDRLAQAWAAWFSSPHSRSQTCVPDV